MADEVTAKDSGVKFLPHPEGQFVAQCVDVVNLGERVKTFPGTPAKVQPVVALVFQTGELREDGTPFEISAEFTVSMNERAGLRLFLEAWRGKSYTEDEAKAGVPLHKLAGAAALISVEHKQSAQGRTYGKIKGISPLPKQMPKPDFVTAYGRQDYWTEKKAKYAEEVKAFKADTEAPHDDFVTGTGETNASDLPF